MKQRDPISTPSPFKALTRAQHEQFVVITSIAAIAVSTLLATMYAFMYRQQPSWPLAVGALQGVPTLIIGLAAWRLARRGQANVGAGILLPYLLMDTALVSVTLGLLPAIAPVYITFIVVAGAVFGPVGGYAIASIASLLWLLAFFLVGLDLPSATPLVGVSAPVVLVILTLASFLLTAFLSQAATSRLWSTLDATAYDLIQANQKLDEANRQKSRFLARMSHDLRTPLTGIILSAGLIKRRLYGDVTEKQLEVLERILHSADRLKILINDILDISKIEAGQLELVEHPVEVAALADTLRNGLLAKAQAKSLAFSVTVAPTMPAAIIGDENRLIQILTNLTDNAIKFTETGSVTVLMEPHAEESWRIVVQDTGRGIREADLGLIFEEFRQANAESDSAAGTGLGLAITRHLARLMDGDIHVQSRLGIGSIFEVTLPLKLEQEPSGS